MRLPLTLVLTLLPLCLTAGEVAPYRLPFAAGTARICTQSNNGKTSHSGRSKHAFDFSMAEGTEVCAARGGRVVVAVDDEQHNGKNGKYKAQGNHVKIDHGDGTTGVYMHLAPGGARVKVGDSVMQGDVIALSGNTGWSTGPHLHFVVNREGQSLPIRFADVETDGGVPASGKTYTSNNVPGIPPLTKDALLALERAASVARKEGAPAIEREAWERHVKTKLAVDYPPQEAARARLAELDGSCERLSLELRALAEKEFALAAQRLLVARVAHRRLPGAKALRTLEADLGADPRWAEVKREARAEAKALERYLRGLREELLGKPKTALKHYHYVIRRAAETEAARRAKVRLDALETHMADPSVG